uniref:Uncharacterized protein n=1 Tax=Cacopsylla melanoneura TaxID=428564 RepID=A0A8D9E544_9HEMI
MKDTETKTIENYSSTAASDVCSVSSGYSFGTFSNGEIEDNRGKGDHVRDDEQYYYDAITKYEQLGSHSNVSYGPYETFGDGSNIPSKRSIQSYNHPNGTNIPTDSNMLTNLWNSSQGNLNKLDGLHKKDSMSTTKSYNSTNDVKPSNMNKFARKIVNEEACNHGNNIRNSERFEAMQNGNPIVTVSSLRTGNPLP